MNTTANLKKGKILIGAEDDFINKKLFYFLLQAKKWAEDNSVKFQLDDGYYSRNSETDWVGGASISLINISDDDIEIIQEMAHSWEVTRLEYFFDITK